MTPKMFGDFKAHSNKEVPVLPVVLCASTGGGRKMSGHSVIEQPTMTIQDRSRGEVH